MAFLTFAFFILFPLFRGSLQELDGISPFQPLSDGTTLVSKGGSFELGFFGPGISNNRYLGIRHKNIPVQTFVWVANRCNPIYDSSGLLMINSTTGNLQLLYQNKSTLWSTKLSKQPKKPKVDFLDSGNLVIREEEDTNPENYLWQSFDYPSDTLLPGMKLGWDLRTGLNRRLSAWTSWDNPCSSGFTWGMEVNKQLHTIPQAIMRAETLEFYRSGPWNGISFSGDPHIGPNPLSDFDFVDNDDEVYYSYNLKNKSVISIIVLNSTTRTENQLVWRENEKSWALYSSSPRDYCDKYGYCTPNGNCEISTGPGMCQCLIKFKPMSTNSDYWNPGCVREHPLSCQKDGFLKYSGLKVPDTSNSWVNKSMNIKECKAKCLSNCSCMAYTHSDIRGEGSGCAIWFGDLIDVRKYHSGGQDLYVRMVDTELVYNTPTGKAESKVRAGPIGKAERKVRAVLISIAIITSVSGMLLFAFCMYRRYLKDKTRAISQNGGEEEDLELSLFILSKISTATDNFSEKNKLGQGGFGPVYRGKLEDGQEIAVKRLSMSSGQGVNEFKNEVKLIAKLQHRNLVKLLGCCLEGGEKLLVYEYMPNKSLDFFIFDQTHGKLLEWSKRFHIICGIARGLLYLHHDSRLRIVHRDLKASNVLLDSEMNPKISDFGMARTFVGDQTEENTNRVVGTYGYMAPEYAFNGLFSTKSDIFSFGILVLEIVSGKKSRAFPHENNGRTLIGHAWTLLKEGRPFELIHVWLRDSYDNMQEVLRCIHVGLLCVQQNPMDRPSMLSVVFMLENENIVLPQPKPPGYFTETEPREIHCSTTNTMTITAMGGR